MESTEKKRQGRSVVIGILLLATLGAGLTWIRYTAQAPSTKNARLISDRVVLATFGAHAARKIREGTKAVVTFASSTGTKFSGTVRSLRIKDQEATALIFLENAPKGVEVQTPCQVTVDTSIAVETLKPD